MCKKHDLKFCACDEVNEPVYSNRLLQIEVEKNFNARKQKDSNKDLQVLLDSLNPNNLKNEL